MSSRGLFCFVVVLLFIPLHIVLLSSNAAIETGLAEARNVLLEMERLNYIRTEIEENVDWLVMNEMSRQLLLGRSKPDELKEDVDERLFEFLKRVEGIYSEEQLRFFVSGKEMTLKELKENTKVLVIKEGNLVYAEFSYTGGLLKDQRLYTEIVGKKAEQRFEIPIGYVIRTGGIVVE